jgi:hypothetical protein
VRLGAAESSSVTGHQVAELYWKVFDNSLRLMELQFFVKFVLE